MRQAGRYLPEYQATRARAGDFLTLCKTPELACEVTLQPVDRLGVDAAILFSDILLPLEAMGLPLSFTEQGPQLEPVRSEADIAALRVPDPEELGFVLETVRLCARALAGQVPLIGFAGAPFTLLSYAVEGKTGKQFEHTKRMLLSCPAAAHLLLERISDTIVALLRAQVAAGAQALQLFDSWIGVLGQEDYQVFAEPYLQRVLMALRSLGVPLIYFAHHAAALLPLLGRLPADVLALDWRLPLDQAAALLGGRRVLQGNLDPCVLLGPVAEIERRVKTILDQAAGLAGHVFNLGHGVLPSTPPAHAQAAVEAVHRLGERTGAAT